MQSNIRENKKYKQVSVQIKTRNKSKTWGQWVRKIEIKFTKSNSNLENKS